MVRVLLFFFSLLMTWTPMGASSATLACWHLLGYSENVHERIAELPIVERHKKVLGSHGAYRAELADGTLVLMKPHSDDWFASIPKEVGSYILAEMIGLPLIPPAYYRLDPFLKVPASVHLYFTDVYTKSVSGQLIDLGKAIWNRNQPKSELIRRGDRFGTDINFLLSVLGYSWDEIAERHVLRRNQQERFLIDLGSAFLSSFLVPREHELQSIQVPQSTLEAIERLKFEEFKSNLAPYFPSAVMVPLFNRIQLLANLLKTLNRETGEIDIPEYRRIIDEYYKTRERSGSEDWQIPQKWKWTDAERPPQIALDFNI